MPVALISAYDKTDLADLGRGLARSGWTVLASGGTKAALSAAGVPALEISEYTGSPEILGGRVKTLHPAIHGGILARPEETDLKTLADSGYLAIDLVVVDLYPFEATLRDPYIAALPADQRLKEIIEKIDIGGVALLRAAAKNRDRVASVCDRADYHIVLAEIESSGGISAPTRSRLAARAFARTAAYDAAIAAWMETQLSDAGDSAGLKLRYGENPHQRARFIPDVPGGSFLGGKVLGGKALSYNNLLDLDAAWRAAARFSGLACVVVKHSSPCGIARREPGEGNLADAVRAAIAGDPVSAFGGIIAVNAPFDGPCAKALGSLFVECIAAPSFSPEALAALEGWKNLRLVELEPPSDKVEYRSILGGRLEQDPDSGDPEGSSRKCLTKRQPTEAEAAELEFAWLACMSVKSNAIVLARAGATVGIGSGQPNRVDSVRIAAKKAGDLARGAVLASDAFFPFPDSIEEAAAAGVTAIIQPAGSVRDAESIEAADRFGIAMVATGVRHFRH